MNRDLGFHARRGVLAEHARDVTERLRCARRLLDQLDEHDLARARAAEPIARHEHAVADARVVGHDEADARLVVQTADDLARVALEHFDDRRLRGRPRLILAADAHGDAIAVHGFEHLARREEDRRRAIVRQQEAVAVLVPADRADDERQALAQAVFVAAIANDLAGVQQLLEFDLSAAARAGSPSRPRRARQFIERERPPRLAQRRQ